MNTGALPPHDWRGFFPARSSKGFIFEPPDFNNAQIGELNEFQDQLSVLLASLSDNQRLQVQWYCDSDYQRELLRYNDETKRATNIWTRRARNERFARYWQAMTYGWSGSSRTTHDSASASRRGAKDA